jgi:hypothetical protein
MTYNRCHDRGVVWNSTESKIVLDVVYSSERKQKVVVLREQERATIYIMSARHLSSQDTCELHLSRDSSSLAYSSWSCI